MAKLKVLQIPQPSSESGPWNPSVVRSHHLVTHHRGGSTSQSRAPVPALHTMSKNSRPNDAQDFRCFWRNLIHPVSQLQLKEPRLKTRTLMLQKPAALTDAIFVM